MAVFKCKMCGGTIEFEQGATVGVCDSCGTRQTLPKLDDDQRANLYGRANHFRRNSDYDKAMGIYEQILNEDKTDAEAYWSIVLCRYGIEYVEDPKTHKRIPTVNRAQYTSIFADADYQSALQYADTMQKSIYEAEAKAIDDIQKGILAISQKEEPFDVFICYKETDEAGKRTPDSVLANDLYHQLAQEGFKVFFSRITLEDKLGSEYEPYIFAALNSAKVMVVLGTKPEYFNAVWVKNEWSRYLTLVKASDGKKMLIPAYKDMDPYDLPDAFSNLQAQDMSKLGFMQDLTRGIRKIVSADEPKSVKETVVVQSSTPASSNYSGLLKRAFIFLEDGKWQEADEYCEKVLDNDPECAEAYLGKLLAALHISKREDLKNAAVPFDGNDNCKKASRYDAKLAKELADTNVHIRERNETAQKEKTYQKAITESQKGTEEGYAKATVLYTSISDYKDAKKRADECRKKAVEARNETIYKTANAYKTNANIADVEIALQKFDSILDYKDARTKADECRKKIEELKNKQEQEEAERRRQEEEKRQREAEAAEAKRIAAEKRKKFIKKATVIGTPIVAAVIVFVIVLNSVIIPKKNLKNAFDLIEVGKYDEAYALMEELGETEKIKASKYDRALALIEAEKYDAAYKLLNEIGDTETIKTNKRERADKLIIEEQYEAAYALYNQIGDSSAITSNKYDRATALIESGDESAAYALLRNLNYKDSDSLLFQLEKKAIRTAKVGDIVTFGNYEQDNNTSNGKEAIEWIVLKKEGDRSLVISKLALDYYTYEQNDEVIRISTESERMGKVVMSNWKIASDTESIWAFSYLRRRLNGAFLEEAFTSDEQNMIQNTTLKSEKTSKYLSDTPNETKDQVFLLSVNEVSDSFTSEDARICIPTAYAKAKNTPESDTGSCAWRLRTPGKGDDRLAFVASNGYINEDGLIYNSSVAIRPAMWIKTN